MDAQKIDFEKYSDGGLKRVTVINQIDLRPTAQYNYEEWKNNPKGYVPGGDMQKLGSVDMAVYMNDPEWQEWHKTRSPILLMKLRQKWPQFFAVR